jgi:hypothetical protein
MAAIPSRRSNALPSTCPTAPEAAVRRSVIHAHLRSSRPTRAQMFSRRCTPANVSPRVRLLRFATFRVYSIVPRRGFDRRVNKPKHIATIQFCNSVSLRIRRSDFMRTPLEFALRCDGRPTRRRVLSGGLRGCNWEGQEASRLNLYHEPDGRHMRTRVCRLSVLELSVHVRIRTRSVAKLNQRQTLRRWPALQVSGDSKHFLR